MDSTEIGRLLLLLRKERGLTQKQLAQALHVSAQAVSKWERGLGCPDVGLLAALSELFGVSMERLLSGDLAPNDLEVGNMKKLKFYVCPVCGSIVTAVGGGQFHCCGRTLEPLAARPADSAHRAQIQAVEEDWSLTFSHPRDTGHFRRFAAYTTPDRLVLVRLYPEQGGEVRIPQLRGGSLYVCCSKDGLFTLPTP